MLQHIIIFFNLTSSSLLVPLNSWKEKKIKCHEILSNTAEAICACGNKPHFYSNFSYLMPLYFWNSINYSISYTILDLSFLFIRRQTSLTLKTRICVEKNKKHDGNTILLSTRKKGLKLKIWLCFKNKTR